MRRKSAIRIHWGFCYQVDAGGTTIARRVASKTDKRKALVKKIDVVEIPERIEPELQKRVPLFFERKKLALGNEAVTESSNLVKCNKFQLSC